MCVVCAVWGWMGVGVGVDTISRATASNSGGGMRDFEFAYDRRVAVVLIPCAVVLMALGGKTFVSACVIGLLFTFLADSVKLRTVSFVIYWFTFICALLALNFWGLYRKSNPLGGTSWYGMFLLLNANTVFVMLGLWGSLHMPSLTVDMPEFAEGGERILFAALNMPASALLMWAVMSLNGPNNAPYYYIALSFVLYRVLMTPLTPSTYITTTNSALSKKSDDKTKPAAAPPVGVYICGSRVTGLNTLLFVLLPAGFYVVRGSCVGSTAQELDLTCSL